MSEDSPDVAALLNESVQGFNSMLGLRYLRATPDEVVAELAIGPQHHQPQGIVHGGVYASLVETVASVGAHLFAMARGGTAVGLENHTSFLHAARDGKLTATAKPLTRGRRSHVWQVEVATSDGKLA